MTASEIQSLFGIKPGTLRQWVHRGRLPSPQKRSGMSFYALWPVLSVALRNHTMKESA